MERTNLKVLLSIIETVMLSLLITVPTFAFSQYMITDLGTIEGGLRSYAHDINNAGKVVGMANNAQGRTHAFLWDSVNGMQDLGTFGGNTSNATAINDLDEVVGYAYTEIDKKRAFLWKNGLMTDLGALNDLGEPDDRGESEAHGINNSSKVVGKSGITRLFKGFIWQSGVIAYLGLFNGFDVQPQDINNSNQIVGKWKGDDWAFLLDNGVITNLGNLGGDFCSAYAINNVGEVVGKSETAEDGTYYAFYWNSASGIQSLV